MKRNRTHGLTLLEMLISLAVMTILLAAAYSTIQESMKLHQGVFQDSARIAQRCDLSEQITRDFRISTRVRSAMPDTWILTMPDGSELAYAKEKKAIVRNSLSKTKSTLRRYDVGTVSVWFRSKGRAWLTEVPSDNRPTAIRIQFPDSELIVAK